MQAAETILDEWGERVVEPTEKKQGATPGPKIVAGERNETLYRFGCKLAREHFSVAEIEAALLTMNATRCDPPLPDADVHAIVHKSVAKHVLPEKNSAPMPAIYSVADMQRRPDTAREWILDQWLPARSNVGFGGHGGSGKSMLTAMLAVCVDAGVPFYGIAVKRGPALVYACEDDIDEWKFRLRCAAAYRGVDFDSLSVRVIDALESERDPALFAPPMTDPRADAAVTPVGAWLADQVKATAPVLVILDAATDAFGGDEIRRREVRRYLRAMRRELAGGGACVVHILHIDKSAARGATTTDLYSGSTDWNNGVRARLAFYRPRQQGDPGNSQEDEETPLRLELQKANYAKRNVFIDLRYDETAHVFVQVGGSEPTVAGDLISSIRKRTDQREVLLALAAAEDARRPGVLWRELTPQCRGPDRGRKRAAENVPQPDGKEEALFPAAAAQGRGRDSPKTRYGRRRSIRPACGESPRKDARKQPAQSDMLNCAIPREVRHPTVRTARYPYRAKSAQGVWGSARGDGSNRQLHTARLYGAGVPAGRMRSNHRLASGALRGHLFARPKLGDSNSGGGNIRCSRAIDQGALRGFCTRRL